MPPFLWARGMLVAESGQSGAVHTAPGPGIPGHPEEAVPKRLTQTASPVCKCRLPPRWGLLGAQPGVCHAVGEGPLGKQCVQGAGRAGCSGGLSSSAPPCPEEAPAGCPWPHSSEHEAQGRCPPTHQPPLQPA